MSQQERIDIQESVRSLFAMTPTGGNEFRVIGWIQGVLGSQASPADQIEEIRIVMECYNKAREKGQS